ncbi:hypothetical protein I3843_05G129500 [Carya illinoinensis]|nr:hypothetical protein I3760_05G141500 [Carya illinoinensis]KAG6713144.1 hypothetical protein I3842_05G137300 [Carya illinoinensis]KAG6713145.1 hypothetical protein I3842_05G137300 [Carya illinoinensis]KAG6713146.1 hypothetical protein I3842_05G137300 [Carya illinoinensis]KAG6713147.1 hypothetical protein I3842_05G137300 [Carya illinoinensis]
MAHVPVVTRIGSHTQTSHIKLYFSLSLSHFHFVFAAISLVDFSVLVFSNFDERCHTITSLLQTSSLP